MSAIDSPGLSIPVRIIGPLVAADLTDGISSDVKLERTMDGASVLTFDVADYSRTLTTSGLLGASAGHASAAVVGGIHFVLVAREKAGDTVTLTFEDAIVNALRQRTSPKTIAAKGTSTRQQIAKLLCSEANVPLVCDPQVREKVKEAVTRNETGSGGGKSSETTYKADPTGTDTSWSILGSVASAAQWRCFSDGKQILFGSDEWLLGRVAATAIAENVGGVGNIDYSFDDGQDDSTATVTVSVDAWSLGAGYPVSISKLGPANGTWLIDRYSAPLNRNVMQGQLDLVRKQVSLSEEDISNSDDESDVGDDDFVPDGDGIDSTDPYLQQNRAAAATSTPSLVGTGNKAKFLTFALNQTGKQYVLGDKGPNTWDCSGLVSAALKAGGVKISGSAASLYQQCQQNGTTVPVSVALKTNGALLFRITPPENHVVISLGDGDRTMEARGAKWGCGVFTGAAKRHWTAGAILF